MLLASSNSNFLIPNGTFIAELIMFIIVLGIVAKFILPSLTGVMDERERNIKSRSAASDEGAKEAIRLADERAKVLREAREQARSYIEVATAQAAAAIEDARERGRAEHGRLMQAAQPTIGAAKEGARQSVLGNVGVLVGEAAQKVIGEPVDMQRYRSLVDDALAQAKS